MSGYVIRIIALAGGVKVKGVDASIGQWIKSANPDACGGIGDLFTTNTHAAAKHFPTAAEAFAYWQAQSTVCPLRDDGQPNRPLTAFTCSIEPA